MAKKYIGVVLLFISSFFLHAQDLWRAELRRQDGNNIVFNFQLQYNNHQPVLYIINAKERLKVEKVRFSKDSVFIQMPVFESQFKAKIINEKKWEGVWIKGGAEKDQVMVFEADRSLARFATDHQPIANISGRWAVEFINAKGEKQPAIAEFLQDGSQVTGTFLTTTGDYRYLSGVVNGNQLQVSTFDGGHAFLFTAIIDNPQKITAGKFYSGAVFVQPWTAVKNANASIPNSSAMFLKAGEDRLNFRFPDLNKKLISINDPQFKNKVVIIQIMGSWCPNCMDETAFLSEYYLKNKQRGVEVIALAYELSNDFERSRKSLQKFNDRFNVQYPILITGATVNDSLRTAKTLPELTDIKMFPSTIFIDKHGKLNHVNTGFFGPGTGEHYIAFKTEFEATVRKLLGQ